MDQTARRTRLSLVLVFGLALGGCAAVDTSKVQSKLASASVCCDSYASVPVEGKLAIDEHRQFELSEASPVYRFPTGLAYFAAFEIPDDAMQIQVQAMNTEFLPKTTYPDPLLVFLDATRQVVAQHSDLPLQRGRFRYLGAFLKYYYGAEVPIPASSRYVVVAANSRSSRSLVAVAANGKVWPVRPAPVGALGLLVTRR